MKQEIIKSLKKHTKLKQEEIEKILGQIQNEMFEEAKKILTQRTIEVKDYKQLKEELDKAKDKISDKAKKETDRFLEKHVEDSDVEKLKDTVKDLFKRK